MVSQVKSLSIKVFGIVNDSSDTCLILNVQDCRLQLEPCLDSSSTAPEAVCLVMQTFYKRKLNEAFIIRQIVDAVVVSKNLLPPVETRRIAAKLSQNNGGCSTASNAKYMLQNLPMHLLC